MLRFLVVDDDEQVADVLKSGLEQYCDAAVTCVSSGAVATQILRNQPLDLAVIDVVLPDLSGFELAERAANCNVPALLISGNLQRQSSCEELDYPHLTKPFSLKALADAAISAVSDTRENIARLHRSHAKLIDARVDTDRLERWSEQLRSEGGRARDYQFARPAAYHAERQLGSTDPDH